MSATETNGPSPVNIIPNNHPPVPQGWRVVRFLGSGTYGNVFQAIDKNGNTVALKVESSSIHSTLFHEFKIYTFLQQRLNPCQSIPKVLSFHTSKDQKTNSIAMPYLGPSVSDLLDNGPLSPYITANIAIKIIDALQHIHNHGIIHCDLKPSNIVTADSDLKDAYLIDFGLARQYAIFHPDHPTLKHPTHGHGYLGVTIYSPIAAHDQLPPRPSHDLESLGYAIYAMLHGDLPWSGIRYLSKRRTETAIAQFKRHAIPRFAAQVSHPLGAYFKYLNELRPWQRIDYEYLRGLFRGCANPCKPPVVQK